MDKVKKEAGLAEERQQETGALGQWAAESGAVLRKWEMGGKHGSRCAQKALPQNANLHLVHL